MLVLAATGSSRRHGIFEFVEARSAEDAEGVRFGVEHVALHHVDAMVFEGGLEEAQHEEEGTGDAVKGRNMS